MCDTFLNKDILDDLYKEKEKYGNGYLIIIDIKDSTIRKNKKSIDWKIHTNIIYNGFLSLVSKIEKQYSDEKDLKKIVCKFTGDGGVVFFKSGIYTGNKEKDSLPNKDISIYIFNNVIDFIEEVKKSSEMLKNIHIKTVITYIRNVYLFKSSDNNTDIIGRGVDFSFRLEKFAEPTHLVVNEMFYESIKEMATNYTGIKCNKMLQGWKEPQLFYLISDIKFFESALGTIVPNPFSNDVNIILACSFLYAAMYIVMMLIIDVSYGIIDPKIRLGKEDS